MPPDRTATATLPVTSILPDKQRRERDRAARLDHQLELAEGKGDRGGHLLVAHGGAVRRPATRLISKVSSPGVCAISASQIVPVSAALRSRRPLLNERAWSSKPSGSAV